MGGGENVFEHWPENFQNLAKDIILQIQEAEQMSNRINSKKPHQDTSFVKILKTKDQENFFKVLRVRQYCTYEGK